MRAAQGLAAAIAMCVSLGSVPAAHAQLAPGLGEPDTHLSAIAQAHSMSCFLAAASRPVPGLNMSMPDNMGEGHFVEENAPEWLSGAIEFERSSNYSRATSGEGDIWIVFENRSKRCTVAVQTAGVAELRAGFEEDVLPAGEWERKNDRSNIGYYYTMDLAGLEFRTTYPDLEADAGLFAVQVTAN